MDTIRYIELEIRRDKLFRKQKLQDYLARTKRCNDRNTNKPIPNHMYFNLMTGKPDIFH